MEKLSIIVPVFNVKRYIRECVESLVRQHYSNFEIIIVDDGSTDGSSELCDELSMTDKRICVIHQQNEGLSAARNTGLKNACGQYISFIDSDDYVSSDMFSKLISAIERTDSSVAICNFEVFNRENKYKSRRYHNEIIEFSPESQIYFYSAALDSSCNRVFKANVIKEHGLTFEHKSIVAQEDYWFQVRLFSFIERIVTIEDCMYYYRERESSITKSRSDGDITKRNLSFYSLMRDYVRQNTERNIDRFLRYLLVNLFSASVNNAPIASPKVINEIVSQYENVPDFIQSVSAESIRSFIKGDRLRDKYSKMTFWLLRYKMKHTYSLIESVRLKRLRSNSRTDLYYE
jgi:glycosyltransferase involved in cell wall biosynthesis